MATVLLFLRILLGGALLPAAAPTESGSDFPFRFKHPVNASSLPAESVSCLIQDQRGFVWLGTENGLFRVEGKRYRPVFSAPGSPGETRIRSLCLDRDSFIWIGTAEQGLFRLDPSTHAYTMFRHNPKDEESLPSDRITHIYTDESHRLWISTEDAGLCRFNFQTGTFIRYTPDSPPSRRLPTLRIGPMASDRSGNLFIGSHGHGIFCLPVKKQEFVPLTSENPLLFTSLTINSLFVDERDILWIGTRERGLYYLNGPWSDERQVKSLPLFPNSSLSPGLPLEITAFHESPYTQNHLWIGSNKGLFLFRRDKGQTFHAFSTGHFDSIAGNGVLSLMEDKGGTLWVGIDSGKFDRVDLRAQFFITRKAGESSASLSQNILTAICQIRYDPAKILLGDRDGTITAAEFGSDRSISFQAAAGILPSGISQFAGLDTANSRIVIRTRDGSLWLHTPSDGSTLPLHPQGIDIQPLCIAPSPWKDAILIGSEKGLHLFHPDRKDRTDLEAYPGCRDLSVTLAQSDNQGGLYLVTNRGVHHMEDLDLASRPIPLTFCDELLNQSKPEISAILCRYNGEVLLGSRRHGLLIVKGRSIEAVKAQFPLQSPASPVRGLFEDDLLQLWVCSAEGLYMLSSSSKNYDEWTLFGEQHRIPLPLAGAGLFEPSTNQLLLTSAQGLLQVNLRDLILPVPSDVVISEMSAVNPDTGHRLFLNPGEDVTVNIPTDYSTLELSFNVHDTLSPEKARVSYRLFGRDPKWLVTDEGDLTVRYRNIDPGSYTLYVNGVNSNRQRGGNGLIFYFVFYVPLLQRPLFWLLSILSALLIIAGSVWLARKLIRRSRQTRPGEVSPVSATDLDQWAVQHGMSEREVEIVRLILAGKSNKEIEEALFISIKTVKSHVYNIYRKAKVKSRFELITLFNRQNDAANGQSGNQSPLSGD